jgi:hypothetical protein
MLAKPISCIFGKKEGPAIVIGSGPSLIKFRPFVQKLILDGCDTFVCNRWEELPLLISPTYLFYIDDLYCDFRSGLHENVLANHVVVRYEMNVPFTSGQPYYFMTRESWSGNIEQPIDPRIITTRETGLHMICTAWHAGYSPIYVFGVDCTSMEHCYSRELGSHALGRNDSKKLRNSHMFKHYIFFEALKRHNVDVRLYFDPAKDHPFYDFYEEAFYGYKDIDVGSYATK